MDDQCPATTRHTPLYSVETYGLQCKFTKGHDGDHCGSVGLATGDVFWPQDTMAEAQDHPGRVITR